MSGNFFLRIITNYIFQISLMKLLIKDKYKLIVLVKKEVFEKICKKGKKKRGKNVKDKIAPNKKHRRCFKYSNIPLFN